LNPQKGLAVDPIGAKKAEKNLGKATLDYQRPVRSKRKRGSGPRARWKPLRNYERRNREVKPKTAREKRGSLKGEGK